MKYRIVQFLIQLTGALLFFRIAIAAESKPSWYEHVDLMQVIIGTLFLTITWFAIRTLMTIDKNQKELFDRMRVVEKDLSKLQGEHEATVGRCRTETG